MDVLLCFLLAAMSLSPIRGSTSAETRYLSRVDERGCGLNFSSILLVFTALRQNQTILSTQLVSHNTNLLINTMGPPPTTFLLQTKTLNWNTSHESSYTAPQTTCTSISLHRCPENSFQSCRGYPLHFSIILLIQV